MAQPRQSTHPFLIELIRTHDGYTVDKFGLVENHNPPAKVTSEADILALVDKPFAGTDSEGESPHLFMPEQSSADPPQPTNLNGNQLKESPAPDVVLVEPPQLPSLSWFRFDRVHDYEISSVPEFFTGKGYKTAELYTKYRNFIVKLFHSDSTRYLTKIACRRALKGDANAILRIHNFLESEGIINFGLAPGGSFDFEYPSVRKTPTSLLHRHPLPPKEPAPESEPEQPNSNSLVYSITARILSKAYRSFCVKCGVTCGMVWFQSKHGTSESCVCEKCQSKMSDPEKQEYDRMDISRRIQAEGAARNKLNWSVEENFKMIEAVTEKDASWESMYMKMGQKRTKEDIIFHFLQFPITNFDPSKNPNESNLALSLQKHIKLIKEFYEKSPYFIYDYSDEPGFQKQQISEDLKALLLMQLEKSTKKLTALQEIEVVHAANELKTNIANILIEMRLRKNTTRPKPIVMEPQLEEPLLPLLNDPLIELPQAHHQQQDPLDYLNIINDDINDVDKFLR